MKERLCISFICKLDHDEYIEELQKVAIIDERKTLKYLDFLKIIVNDLTIDINGKYLTIKRNSNPHLFVRIPKKYIYDITLNMLDFN